MSATPTPHETPARATHPAQAIGLVLGRSLFPFASLAIIAGTLLWGPWVTLVLALLWWHVVTRIG